MGIHKNTLVNYENNDRKPDSDFYLKLMDLGYNPNWVLTGEGPMMLEDLHWREGGPDGDDEDEFVYVDRWVMKGEERELTIQKIAFRKDWVRKKGLQPWRLSFFDVRDDSMEPTIRKGALLLIHTYWHKEETEYKIGLSSEEPFPGDGIYIIELPGDRMITRRLQQHTNGSISIIADNKTWDSQFIEKNHVPIIGKVIWYGQEA